MMECQVCHKKMRIGYNKPHSLHRTKRKIYPNIQKIHGQHLCMDCLRTANRKSK